MEDTDRTIRHFHDHGWMRVPRAFDGDAAANMREAIWRALADLGFRPDEPSTWTTERPAHLQHLKVDPAFRAVGSEILLAAIAEVFEGRPYDAPKDWGAFFLAFPSDAKWGVPTSGWHIDANYTGALWPAGGVKTHALLGDVVPRGGGTQIVSGSHRLVHQWFEENPPPPGARGADMRKLLQANPYIRDLHREGDSDERIARFMDRTEAVDGIPLRVIEITGAAGDVILVHPLVLHVAAPNKAAEPRFLLSGGITTDIWG
jgi:hypothetical protein